MEKRRKLNLRLKHLVAPTTKEAREKQEDENHQEENGKATGKRSITATGSSSINHH